MIVVSLVFWIVNIYRNLTVPIAKFGGEYSEGVVGQPMYINPILSQASDADSDLSRLIYSGLFKYDSQGKIINDLAEGYEISDDKKSYTIRIKKNVLWHDGEILNVDDVVFTFNILKDSAYKSPLRQNWQGVEVSKVDDYSVKFDLQKPYFGFLENLTIGILPKHIWENIAPDRFSLAEKNLKPIGSGPYMFSDFQKDSNGNIITYKLIAFKNYYEGSPYIAKINLNFYKNDEDLIAAFNRKEVLGMNAISPEKIESVKVSKNFEIKEIIIPRYFALFVNQTKNVALAYDEVRRALSIGTNRQEIIDDVLHGKGIPLYSPLFPQMNGYADVSNDYAYDAEKAKKILDDAGWIYNENEGMRKKGDDKLEFEIVTTDWPELTESAEILKSQWEKLGVNVNVSVSSVSDFQQNYIRTREYSSLLFGQALSFNPDLYSYWHSSNKRDPGLNLSLFENKEADELLDSIRQETNEGKRTESLREFNKIMIEKNPAIFLYSQYYLYPISRSINGMDVQNINSPSWRFANVNKWYIKTKRIRKK